MRSLVLLSGENIELAMGELRGIIESTGVKTVIEEVDDRIVILDGALARGSMTRMGFAHFYSERFGSTEDRSKEGIDDLTGSVLEDCDNDLTVSVKIISPGGKGHLSRSSLFERFCSMAVERGLTLKHRDPAQRAFISVGNRIHSGIIEETSDRKSVNSRRGSRMPFNRPVVMEPKLARVMVNLSGLPRGSLILDPFMGPAGLAIESGLLGHRVIGIERDPEIYRGAIENIRALGLSDSIDCYLGDSRSMKELDWWDEIGMIDGVITDPPFGRAAPLMGENPGDLLNDVLERAAEKMEEGGIVVLDTDREERLKGVEGFRTEKIFSFRVHGSLTRYFAKLVRY